MKCNNAKRQQCLFLTALLLFIGMQIPAHARKALPPGVVLVGDVYYIPNEGVEVNGRSRFKLKRGTYRFATEKAGHRLKIHEVVIDHRKSRLIRVEPGQGFAIAEFTFTPEADQVVVANAASPEEPALGLDSPWRVELDAGHYRVEARAEGHLPFTEEFEVLPNEPVHLDRQFTPKPTSAPLLITTTPVGAELFVDGVWVGNAPKQLETVKFDTHRISAYVYSDSDNRVAFEDDMAFSEDSAETLELTLRVEQRRFEGQWYDRAEAERLEARKRLREQRAAEQAAREAQRAREEAAREARRAEEQAYREAREGNPLEIQVQIPALADRQLTTLNDFSRALFMLLRVGDRLRVTLAGTEHLVWKRSSRTNPAFESQVEALWTDQPLQSDYADDPVRSIVVSPGSSLVTTIPYQLYRRVNDHPILDLGSEMHNLEGVSVHTLATDGATTLLTFGGSNVVLNGRNVKSTRQLGFVRLRAGDRKLDLTWDEAPQRVLIVSARNRVAQPTLPSAELNLNQKHVVKLGVDGKVQSFHRFTEHPDGTWRHFAKEGGGSGLAALMDLDSDEAGPHTVSGKYRREWLIDYETAEGKRATRQVEMDYTVGETAQPVEASEFIRLAEP